MTIVEELIASKQIDVNYIPEGKTRSMLFLASHGGRHEIVEFLLKDDNLDLTSVNHPDESRNPLLNAISHGHRKVVELLVRYPGIDLCMRFPRSAVGQTYSEHVQWAIEWTQTRSVADCGKAYCDHKISQLQAIKKLLREHGAC